MYNPLSPWPSYDGHCVHLYLKTDFTPWNGFWNFFNFFFLTTWTQDVNWTYIRCSKEVFWLSYARSIYVCIQGELKQGRIFLCNGPILTVVNVARIPYHAPISSARSAAGLLKLCMKFTASNLISTILFNKAKNGARGKAATNMVTKPYCSTKTKNFKYVIRIRVILWPNTYDDLWYLWRSSDSVFGYFTSKITSQQHKILEKITTFVIFGV